ncbi:hypothetical protein AARAC_010920 [Aspergillus arachidicola]|uniref:Dynamin n=1 Tax=Aspergillus arachidicola TaxID=656916 RepID=A0A2G7FVJ2_9EURO|nr:hypothetical protein AARAC_010920 [Aspergillus arachidicola]
MTIKHEEGGSPVVLAEPALLEKIDKLFACNVGEHINLPQLVVVGDQSSGKSSVLEGLTKLTFPRNSGLCTRFATQIIFRRVASLTERRIFGSIISATKDTGNEKVSWSVSDIQVLDETTFSKMMSDVHAAMGLSTMPGDDLPSFSSDVLRLEIHGPTEDHLSVIDVPGIFKTTTPGLTTKSDIALVRDLVFNYMRNPRSIMLAVVPGNVDIATQEIIEMARELDPDGNRTLGIITKPDLVDEGAEDKILDLVEQKNDPQNLGWVVVRNLGQKELLDRSKDRDFEEERFHQSSPWNRLASENFGIKALRSPLQALLASNVRREFPLVRSEVSKRLKDCKKILEDLGEERGTVEQQRKYLLEIISRFNRLTQNALTTNYGTQNEFDEEPDLRLATKVAIRNAALSEDFAIHGHTFDFRSQEHENDMTRTTYSRVRSGLQVAEHIENDAECNQSQETLPSRKVHGCSDIEDILYDCVQIPKAAPRGIIPWIDYVYQSSRGFEIGTFNGSLLSSVLKKQTSKWPALAQGYISDVISMVHAFTSKALQICCGDCRVGRNILLFLIDGLTERYGDALSHTNFLLRIEREGTPMTLNHYLNDNLQKCRQERITAAAKKVSFTINEGNGMTSVVRISDLNQQHHMSNSRHTVQDIHDILESYYKVIRKRFIDNMCTQAADYYLVTGPAAPMNLFSSSWVHDLTSEQLEEIAGEEPSVRRKREGLQKKVKELEAGRKILL